MKTLVLYATKYGSSREAAKMIADALGGAELHDLRIGAPVLDGYDEVILGGPVYIGHMLKPVRSYMDAHSAELLRIKLGLFICSGNPEGTDGYPDAIFPQELCRHAAAVCMAGGALKITKLKLFDRWIVNMVSRSPAMNSFTDVHINSDAIQRFALAMRR